MEVDADAVYEAAVDYGQRGWRVIPLHPPKQTPDTVTPSPSGGSSEGKVPVMREWQKYASANETVIDTWFGERGKYRGYNIGVVMGRFSNLIDMECDNEKEEADLSELFHGNVPLTPTFTSGRGKHRLFKFPVGIPSGAVVSYGKLKIRAGNNDLGAQSVFPPSVHWTGSNYSWLPGLSPDDLEPPEIQEWVVKRLWTPGGAAAEPDSANGKPDVEDVLSGVAEGSRNEAAATLAGYLLRNTKDVNDPIQAEFVWDHVRRWNEQNRPPLPDKELRTTWKSILKKEKERRIAEESAASVWSHEAEVASTNPWKLYRRDCDPPLYIIYAPIWEGGVTVLTKVLLSATLLREAICEQKGLWLDRKAWISMWEKGSGSEPPLAKKLIETMTIIDDLPETRRRDGIFTAIKRYTEMHEIKTRANGTAPDHRGHMQFNERGDLEFEFGTVADDFKRMEDKYLRHELSDALKELGGKSVQLKVAGKKYRRYLIPRDGLNLIEEKIAKMEPENDLQKIPFLATYELSEDGSHESRETARETRETFELTPTEEGKIA